METLDAKIHRTTRIKHIERELGETMLGAVVGAVTGAIAGPPGIVVGAVFGGLVGLLAGVVGEREDARAAIRTAQLDRELGVTHGSMGTRWVRHLAPRVGAYSMGSTGASQDHGATPAEGPMSEGDANWR